MSDDRRAALKAEYKNRKPNMGIFQIKNNVNGKIFLAASPNLDGALNRYNMAAHLGLDYNLNRELTREMKEFGIENFSFEVLDRLKPQEDPAYDYKEDLKTLEALWMEKLQPYGERGYHAKKER